MKRIIFILGLLLAGCVPPNGNYTGPVIVPQIQPLPQPYPYQVIRPNQIPAPSPMPQNTYIQPAPVINVYR